MSTDQTIFDTLYKIDVSAGIQKKETGNKKQLDYLSWSYAWGILKQTYPNSSYKVVEFDGKPYLHDENLGYLVTTEVTINDETLSMRLPVLNENNKAMKHVAYTYEVANWVWDNQKQKNVKNGTVAKTVEPATMFDINTAIMRCLVKNIALFGLGLSLYKDSDFPFEIEEKEKKAEEERIKQEQAKAEQAKAKIQAIAEGVLNQLETGEVKDFQKLQLWVKTNKQQIEPELLSNIEQKINEFVK